MSLREAVKHTPPPNANKSSHSGFETQEMSPEVQNGGISGPQKGLMSSKIKKKRFSITKCYFT